LPLQIQKAKNFFAVCENLMTLPGFFGANITLPFKSDAFHLRGVKKSLRAELVQSGNTLFKNEKNSWCLENTAVPGVEETLKVLLQPQEHFQMIVLGGGGGAASALFCGVNHPNCHAIVCLTRNPQKTRQRFFGLHERHHICIKMLSNKNLDSVLRAFQKSQFKIVLVNTLPLFKNPYALLLIHGGSRENFCYFDMVYDNTSGIVAARQKNISCQNGRLMFFTQAKESFYLWTGYRIKNGEEDLLHF
jgi:shikimate 5-dehydrogenase